MTKKFLLLSFTLIFLTVATPVFAVPTLQLYVPGATYYEVNPWFPESEDSWITSDNPFQLHVVGATTPEWVEYIYDVNLYVALLEEEYLLYKDVITTSLFTIEDNDPNIDFTTVNLTWSDFTTTAGRPYGVAPHGIYPTYYACIPLPNLLVGGVNGAGETVYDYNIGFDPDNPEASGRDAGDNQYYIVSYDPHFRFMHLDLTGIAHNGKEKFAFAPYSHDVDIVPEPSTLLLLGVGLIGLAGAGIKKRLHP